uniref:VWFA domain-containing protein n=1 Tax=Panagrellus redivivus TaxID=6233 RepID=A0A7E4V3Q6_PANRE
MSRIAVFTSDKVGFCATRDKVTHTKLYDGNINEAVKAFAKDVPPDSVCATYVQRGDHCELPTLRKLLPTLKAAGYKNIHVYRALCSNTSIALYVANLKCKVENSVAVFHVFSAQRIARGGVDEHSDGVFVGKVPNGYELLLVSDEISDSMELFDNLKHIVIVADDASAKADIRAKYDKELKKDDVTVHVISFDADDYVCAFLWNKYDNGNFNGNLVADSASTMFSFEYEEQKLTLYAEYQLLPYSKVFQIDIFDAESLKVEASFTPDDTTCINSVSFDPSKRRIIQATVSIGLDHLPNVKLATIECEVPGLTKAIRPAGKTSKATALLILLSSTRPQLTVIHSRVEDTREFTSVTELMAYIRRPIMT